MTKMTRLYILACIQGASLAGAIIVPFYAYNNISEANMYVLTSLYMLALLLREIPTGLIASYYGEKYSILTGFMLLCCSFIFLPFANSFSHFGVYICIAACGMACLSGSMSAFIKSITHKYKKSFLTIRKQYKITHIGSAIVLTIIGPILVSYIGYTWTFLIQAMLFLCAATIILSFGHNLNAHTRNTWKELIHTSLDVLLRKEILWPSIIVYGFLAIEAGIFISLQHSRTADLSLPLRGLGRMVACVSVVAMIFSYWLPSTSYPLGGKTLLLRSSMSLCSIIAYIYIPSIYTLIGLLSIQSIRALDISVENRILENIDSNAGSTILSYIGFFERLLFISISLTISLSMSGSFHVLAGYSIIIILLYIVGRLYNTKKV